MTYRTGSKNESVCQEDPAKEIDIPSVEARQKAYKFLTVVKHGEYNRPFYQRLNHL